MEKNPQENRMQSSLDIETTTVSSILKKKYDDILNQNESIKTTTTTMFPFPLIKSKVSPSCCKSFLDNSSDLLLPPPSAFSNVLNESCPGPTAGPLDDPIDCESVGNKERKTQIKKNNKTSITQTQKSGTGTGDKKLVVKSIKNKKKNKSSSISSIKKTDTDTATATTDNNEIEVKKKIQFIYPELLSSYTVEYTYNPCTTINSTTSICSEKNFPSFTNLLINGGAAGDVQNFPNTKITNLSLNLIKKNTKIKPLIKLDDDGNSITTINNKNNKSGQRRKNKAVLVVSPPTLGVRSPNLMDLTLYLQRIQEYFKQLGYQRIGEPKLTVNTHMSIKHQMETAKNLIKASQPIKCLHALILAIHFTNCTQLIERFPIHFRSEYNGREFRHVVLGIYMYGNFGALGISRDPALQDKPPSFSRLTDLISEFYKSYTESGHVLIEARIGCIVTHDPHSQEAIPWKQSTINFNKTSPLEVEAVVEKISRGLRAKMGSACLRQIRPNQFVFPGELIATHQKRQQQAASRSISTFKSQSSVGSRSLPAKSKTFVRKSIS